jgi:hypothetical protein
MIKPAKELPSITKKVEDRFWRYVEKRRPDECWFWTGYKDRGGYGVIHIGSRLYLVHRMSWVIHFGAIPSGFCVCHNCPGGDQRLCVNPIHLWLGTVSENNADCVRKGRAACGEKNGRHTQPESTCRGERSGRAKLTEADVLEIRRIYAMGGISHAALATRFGIKRTSIGYIVLRKNWRHIE